MFILLSVTGVFTMLIGHTNLTVVETAMFLQGTAIMGFFAIGLMAISRMFRMEERGMASGLLTTMGAVFGSGLLPYLFGLAGDHFSFRLACSSWRLVALSVGSSLSKVPNQGESRRTRECRPSAPSYSVQQIHCVSGDPERWPEGLILLDNH
jgi:MFS family permease